MQRLNRLVAQACASPLPSSRLAEYPLEGTPPEGEDTGIKMNDNSPERRMAGSWKVADGKILSFPLAPGIGPAPMDEVQQARAKYEEERKKRVEVPRGNSQYQRVSDLAKTDGRFAKMLQDPFIDFKGYSHLNVQYPAARGGRPLRPVAGPVTDVIDYAIVGGGYGGVFAAGRLREQGIPASEIRVLEVAGDVGGTWYWNRYPGAMCDVESYVYMPFAEEMKVAPTEKYAHQPELYGHVVKAMEFFGLYEKSLFGTKVQELRWDELAWNWRVTTDKGDDFRAKFVIINFGIFSQPKLPITPQGLEIQNFEGHMLHTARWDFDYTGGSPLGGMTKLADKRVAIIGTGPTSVQAVPHLAETSKHLYVFQRTPGTVNVRNNRKTSPEFAKEFLSKPGWQRERIRNFAIQTETPKDMIPEGTPDLVDDGWTWYSFVLSLAGETLDGKDKSEMNDLTHMKQLRNRVASIVQNEQTAESLKPYYKLGCKRPCFHDEYLYTFNRPNVTLVDCPRGVEGFTKKGILVNGGKEYEVDCIVLATGFESGLTISIVNDEGSGDVKKRLQYNDYEVYGKNGVSLSEAWAKGPRTFNAMNARGFPNMYIGLGPQGALGNNVVDGLETLSSHFAHCLGKMRREGLDYIEPTEEATEEYCQLIYENSGASASFFQECTPGWLSNEGQFTGGKTLNGGYPLGSTAFNEMLAEKRQNGTEFAGMDVRQKLGTPPERVRKPDA